MMKSLRAPLVFLTVLLFIFCMFLIQCQNDNPAGNDIRGSRYADAQTCVKCHKDITATYEHSNHFHTSGKVVTAQLLATFSGHNSYKYNDSIQILISHLHDSLFQSTIFKNKLVKSESFDVSFGANRHAQTYAYWKGNQLFELPLSYFQKIKNFGTSPGFPSDIAYYNRAIVSRCFECHASFADKQYTQGLGLSVREEYDKNAMIYGIDCQRCHGPSAAHVNFHTRHPEEKKAKYITTYQSLSRQQKLDMCAVCHFGSDQHVDHSTFNFKPGDTLANFYEPSFGLSVAPDVHGYQYNLLQKSKCFISSSAMTCTTCHDSHSNTPVNVEAYVQKCNSCHSPTTHVECKLKAQLGTILQRKCLDCHMPSRASKLITYNAENSKASASYYLRTHQIAVYKQDTQKILSFIKGMQ